MKKSILLATAILCLAMMSKLQAQEAKVLSEAQPLKDSLYLKKKDYQKQLDYENYKYAFPAKKKSMWALGIHAGYAAVLGDVSTKYGWGAGINIEKSLGHVFALRIQGMYSQVTGQDVKSTGLSNQFRNFKLNFSALELQGVAYLNNINFYKRNTKVLVYAVGGLGLSTRNTKMNMTDDNNAGAIYDYTGVVSDPKFFQRGATYKAIKNINDKTYETGALVENTTFTIKNNQINPSISLGAGFLFKLSKRIDLNVEEKISWHHDNYLDGTKFSADYVATTKSDFFSYTNIGINLKLGKREEPLYWVNPLVKPYDDIMALKSTLYSGDFMKDEDDDGVVDLFDKELNTHTNTMVNTHGISLDIDGDGISDKFDDEPFSPKRARVDKSGRALDSDDDGIADVNDKQNNTPANAQADAKGFEIKSTNGYASVDPKIFDPVFFDLNKTNVKQEFYPSIYKVAMYMQNNPSAIIKVLGHTDNRATDDYNVKLAQKRAEAVVTILINAFGLTKERFAIEALGKADPVVPNLPVKFDPIIEGGHYLNRRVTFEVQ
jgi:outer membrane protein OmpA-like peptidoglycan-associated protein